MNRILKEYYQELNDEFEEFYHDIGCSCHINPPCSWCVHPGNPANLAEDYDAWEDPKIDQMKEADTVMDSLVEALNFYVLICGNTGQSISAETAKEMYGQAQKALTNFREYKNND